MVDKDDFLGDVTKIDTEGLWLCGASFFPSMAVSHQQAGSGIGDSAAMGSEGFTRQRSVPHPPYTSAGSGPIYGSWVAVRDEFQNVLRESVENLYTIGDALEKIAWAAAEEDGTTEQLINKVDAYIDSDERDTDDEIPIWDDGDRPMPPTPEESEQEREEEEEERQNQPPGPPYP